MPCSSSASRIGAPARYHIDHVSRYSYVCDAYQEVMALRLQPRTDRDQHLLAFQLEISPPSSLTSTRDCYGNVRHLLHVHRPHRFLEVHANCQVQAAPSGKPPGEADDDGWRTVRESGVPYDEWDFTQPSPLTRPTPALRQFIRQQGIAPVGGPWQSLRRLSDALGDAFTYTPGSTAVDSPIDHILQTRAGVCQDYAHVMIAIARSWGIPSRYVSGYVHDVDGPASQASANATHAWVECRLPQIGWLGLDPTNRCLAGDQHIRIAHGRDYQDAAPTRGVHRGGGEARLEVRVEVRQLGQQTVGLCS